MLQKFSVNYKELYTLYILKGYRVAYKLHLFLFFGKVSDVYKDNIFGRFLKYNFVKGPLLPHCGNWAFVSGEGRPFQLTSRNADSRSARI